MRDNIQQNVLRICWDFFYILLFLKASWGLAKRIGVYLEGTARLLVLNGVMVDHGVLFTVAVLLPRWWHAFQRIKHIERRCAYMSRQSNTMNVDSKPTSADTLVRFSKSRVEVRTFRSLSVHHDVISTTVSSSPIRLRHPLRCPTT